MSNGKFFAIRLWPRYLLRFLRTQKKSFTKLHSNTRNTTFRKDNPSLQQFLGHFCRIFYRRSFRLDFHYVTHTCTKCYDSNFHLGSLSMSTEFHCKRLIKSIDDSCSPNHIEYRFWVSEGDGLIAVLWTRSAYMISSRSSWQTY